MCEVGNENRTEKKKRDGVTNGKTQLLEMDETVSRFLLPFISGALLFLNGIKYFVRSLTEWFFFFFFFGAMFCFILRRFSLSVSFSVSRSVFELRHWLKINCGPYNVVTSPLGCLPAGMDFSICPGSTISPKENGKVRVVWFVKGKEGWYYEA